MSSEQWLKTIDFIQDAYEAGSSDNLAAGLGKLAAMTAAGGLTEAYLRTAMPMIRLGYAISGRSDQWAKWKAFTGWAAGEITGRLIDEFNDWSPGAHIYDWTHPDPTAVNTGYHQATRTRPPVARDPLAIDLDGDGIETVGSASNPVLFDHNADGIRTGTGWVRPDDAWLVLDRNANGLIDSGRELFGVDTLLSGTPGVDAVYAPTGFAALAQLDANADGVFNTSDAAFTQVRLWQDADQDGVSDAGELFSLAEMDSWAAKTRATQRRTGRSGSSFGLSAPAAIGKCSASRASTASTAALTPSSKRPARKASRMPATMPSQWACGTTRATPRSATISMACSASST
jgi:hypothetical protein